MGLKDPHTTLAWSHSRLKFFNDAQVTNIKAERFSRQTCQWCRAVFPHNASLPHSPPPTVEWARGVWGPPPSKHDCYSPGREHTMHSKFSYWKDRIIRSNLEMRAVAHVWNCIHCKSFKKLNSLQRQHDTCVSQNMLFLWQADAVRN